MSKKPSKDDANAMAEQLRHLQNRQKILLNKKSDLERRARTKRLIEHGAILESVFAETATRSGTEIIRFLSDLSPQRNAQPSSQTD